MNKSGFSMIELIIVMAILMSLSYFAIPSAELVQVKLREKLLHERLQKIRYAIDQYKAARAEDATSPYPPTLASLTEIIPTAMLKYGANSGPFIASESFGNPFSARKDVFIWDIRDDGGTWTKNSESAYDSISCYDIRFPEDGLNGWKKATDGTLYKNW